MLALDESCTQEIRSGFDSSALGGPYHYSAGPDDQINLLGSFLRAMGGMAIQYVCTDQSGNKLPRMHTPQEFQQVYQDGATAKATLIFKFHQLRAHVEGAATIAEVEAIHW